MAGTGLEWVAGMRSEQVAETKSEWVAGLNRNPHTGAIVNSIMQEKGIPGGDIRARDLIHRTVLSSLSRSPSVIERVTVDGQISWRVRG